ncbi:MAG: hypothetical protein ACLS70_02260 [[Clostridium] symbiosum]
MNIRESLPDIYYIKHSIRTLMKKSILPVIPVLILILLLMRPALAFDGAKSGLLLWFNVVLPTLLPFMLCSSLLVAWGGVPLITRPFAPLFRLLGLSDKGSYALMSGLDAVIPWAQKQLPILSVTAAYQATREKTSGHSRLSQPHVRRRLHTFSPGRYGSFPFIAAAVYLPVIINGFLVQLFYRERKKLSPLPCRSPAMRS